MFANLVTRIGENEFWQKFLQALNEEDAEKIMNMSNRQLKWGHNPDDIEERMNFINDQVDKYDNNQFLDIMDITLGSD